MSRHATEVTFRWMLTIVLVSLALSIAAKSAVAEASTEAVARAIQQNICFKHFWRGDEYFPFGKTVPITLRKDGEITYVWSDELEFFPHVSRVATFLTVFSKNDRTVVGSAFGFNLDSMQEIPDFKMKRQLVFGGTVEIVQLRIPTDCTPRFAAETPLKQRMLQTIKTSVTNELTFFNKPPSRSHYPRQLQIIIANFNVDDPEVEVFVPVTKQVLHMPLRDPDDPFSGKFLGQDGFPVRPEYNKQWASVLARKIIKHGIVREITLDGGQGATSGTGG